MHSCKIETNIFKKGYLFLRNKAIKPAGTLAGKLALFHSGKQSREAQAQNQKDAEHNWREVRLTMREQQRRIQELEEKLR